MQAKGEEMNGAGEGNEVTLYRNAPTLKLTPHG
jgi:hypothetical protein